MPNFTAFTVANKFTVYDFNREIIIRDHGDGSNLNHVDSRNIRKAYDNMVNNGDRDEDSETPELYLYAFKREVYRFILWALGDNDFNPESEWICYWDLRVEQAYYKNMEE